MKLRLAILFAVLGQLVAGGLCASICAPLLGPSDCAAAVEAAPQPMGCCAEPTPVSPCAPETPRAPRQLPSCCFTLPPVLPATMSPTLIAALAPAFADAPLPWTAPILDDPRPITCSAVDPPGPPGRVNDRLASMCVWTI